MSDADLVSEAFALTALGASVVSATDIGSYAMEYAVRNWAVFPLRGKVPAIAGGHGVLDATTDTSKIAAWWGGSYVGANIGCRVPNAMMVVDIDPRNGGHEALAALQAKHGALPDTLTTISGRGDGGKHLFFRRPAGQISARRLGRGIDLKCSTGYVVMPPSIHPENGERYKRVEGPIAAPPAWLERLLLQEPVRVSRSSRPMTSIHMGPSVADTYSSQTSWGNILTPHGWRCLDADPDADGARWRHPTATSPSSATVRHGCLFVYSTNTPFDVTEPDSPRGYTRFRAYAVLNHDGDLRAASRALSRQVISL